MLKLYWKYMQKRHMEKIKLQVKMWGGKIDEDEELQDREELAKKMHDDPLFNFPYDVEYLDARQCREKVRITQRFGTRLPKHKFWDVFRMNSCLGKHGIVAKRCSMNDVLWSRFLHAKNSGGSLTLKSVEKMIRMDIKRRELYPPDYAGDGSESPPESYLEKLRSWGKLQRIYAEIDSIVRS